MTTDTGDKPLSSSTPEVDPRLLELLVCPITKTSLEYDRSKGELISRSARLAFPIREGVPLMTLEAARQLDEDDMKPRATKT